MNITDGGQMGTKEREGGERKEREVLGQIPVGSTFGELQFVVGSSMG